MSSASRSVATQREADRDSTPSDGGERITRLFPKCRPRNMHSIRDRSSSAVDSRHNDINNLNNLSSDDDRRDADPNLLILNSKGGSYKLRDSRIIEIAGGRELYSASRSKAARKLRHSGTHKHAARHKQRAATGDDAADYTQDSIMRISNHDGKKMVSKQTSPSYVNGGRALKHTQNNGLASPEPQAESVAQASQKGSPIAVVADGHVVVVDDITQDWKGLRLNLDASDDGSASPLPPEPALAGGPGPTGGKGTAGGPRVIGELPIAEYEGSPRRYGPAVRSPRPGFPQRVVEDSNSEAEGARPASSAAFDYLYEFSETRKVLEEFFRGPGGPGHPNPEEAINFQELEYSLVRQQQTASPPASPPLASPLQRRATPADCSPDASWQRRNSPVERSPEPSWQRRASPAEKSPEPSWQRRVSPVERSPDASWRRRAPPPRRFRDDSPTFAHHHNFLGVQTEPYERELNVVELSVGTDSAGSGGGEAGVGAAGALPPRAPLTPDTTDCESNCGDLDSELSLAIVENDEKGVESGRERSTRAGLAEDGLSSHASDNDNNNIHTLPTVQLSQTLAALVSPPEPVEDSLGTLLVSHADVHVEPAAGSEVSPPPPAPAPHRHDPPPLRHHPLWIPGKRANSAASTESVERKPTSGDEDEADTDLETDRLLGQQRTDDQGFFDDKGWRKPKSRTVLERAASSGASAAARSPPHGAPDADPQLNAKDKEAKKKGKNKEAIGRAASVLIEGVLFRARYLGSTQLACEGQPTKATRMLQAEEAVSRIKAPEGESQPSTEVDLFISTEKIMVLNTELKEIMMDHALRTISYIADIGELVVLMARRRFVPHDADSEPNKIHRTPKMICHVFESEEAQFIAQSIGQAFQVAYMEFLKANGIEDHSFVKEMDYQEVLNSQEIFGDELQMFAKKELQKEVVVPKAKGEILGVVVVESGWGSMLPTVVIANLAPAGAAARCGHLNIGDQIIAINGVSLVGLPLSTCQTYIKNSRTQTVVKLTVVPCPPVVEVKIKRPDTKYQLGFSVQNGVICSLLRGGIAERGGVRVGHRIIEINAQSVVAVPHERIVNLLATSVGEILMKTMPTSMFRLLTGQENPVYI